MFKKTGILALHNFKLSRSVGAQVSLFYGNRTFLYFGKGIFRTLAYLEPEAYAEPEAYLEHCQTSTMEGFVKIATWLPTFSAHDRKIKKDPSREKFLYPNMKQILTFFQKKAVLLFQETETRKNLYFLKRKLFSYFRKRKPRKRILYNSGNGTFLYFRKQKP